MKQTKGLHVPFIVGDINLLDLLLGLGLDLASIGSDGGDGLVVVVDSTWLACVLGGLCHALLAEGDVVGVNLFLGIAPARKYLPNWTGYLLLGTMSLGLTTTAVGPVVLVLLLGLAILLGFVVLLGLAVLLRHDGLLWLDGLLGLVLLGSGGTTGRWCGSENRGNRSGEVEDRSTRVQGSARCGWAEKLDSI